MRYNNFGQRLACLLAVSIVVTSPRRWRRRTITRITTSMNRRRRSQVILCAHCTVRTVLVCSTVIPTIIREKKPLLDSSVKLSPVEKKGGKVLYGTTRVGGKKMLFVILEIHRFFTNCRLPHLSGLALYRTPNIAQKNLSF